MNIHHLQISIEIASAILNPKNPGFERTKKYLYACTKVLYENIYQTMMVTNINKTNNSDL